MSQVTIQSVVTGVAPILINTVLQPCGMFIFLTKPSFIMVARCFPALCILDPPCGLLDLLYLWSRGLPPRRALQQLARLRGADGPVVCEHPTVLVTRVLLALVSLAQLAKVMSFQGTPWVRFVAMAYAISWAWTGCLGLIKSLHPGPVERMIVDRSNVFGKFPPVPLGSVPDVENHETTRLSVQPDDNGARDAARNSGSRWDYDTANIARPRFSATFLDKSRVCKACTMISIGNSDTGRQEKYCSSHVDLDENARTTMDLALFINKRCIILLAYMEKNFSSGLSMMHLISYLVVLHAGRSWASYNASRKDLDEKTENIILGTGTALEFLFFYPAFVFIFWPQDASFRFIVMSCLTYWLVLANFQLIGTYFVFLTNEEGWAETYKPAWTEWIG